MARRAQIELHSYLSDISVRVEDGVTLPGWLDPPWSDETTIGLSMKSQECLVFEVFAV